MDLSYVRCREDLDLSENNADIRANISKNLKKKNQDRHPGRISPYLTIPDS